MNAVRKLTMMSTQNVTSTVSSSTSHIPWACNGDATGDHNGMGAAAGAMRRHLCWRRGGLGGGGGGHCDVADSGQANALAIG